MSTDIFYIKKAFIGKTKYNLLPYEFWGIYMVNKKILAIGIIITVSVMTAFIITITLTSESNIKKQIEPLAIFPSLWVLNVQSNTTWDGNFMGNNFGTMTGNATLSGLGYSCSGYIDQIGSGWLNFNVYYDGIIALENGESGEGFYMMSTFLVIWLTIQ